MNPPDKRFIGTIRVAVRANGTSEAIFCSNLSGRDTTIVDVENEIAALQCIASSLRQMQRDLDEALPPQADQDLPF